MFRFSLCILVIGLSLCSARAGFTSMYVFGDGVSTMTNNPFANGTNYYGLRRTNGRTWVEVLAQRQGFTLETNKNWSYFGHYSSNLVNDVISFGSPADVNTALFVVWVNNADFVYDITQYAPYTTNNIAVWTNAMNLSLSNHSFIIQTLYNKGVRTLVMPNAVDLTKVPGFAALTNTSKDFIRQRIVDYNVAFTAKLGVARSTLSNLTIHS